MIESPRRVAGIVLAAGGSTRFGRPKPLLPWGGQALLAHILDQIESLGLYDLVVVTGAAGDAVAQVVAGRARIAHNPEWKQGQSASLRAGLQALRPDAAAALFFLADQPEAHPEVAQQLIARWWITRARAVAPRYGGQRGTPVLFDRSAFADLAALEGDVGGCVLLARYGVEVAWVDVPCPPPSDVDTPEDYHRCLAEWSLGKNRSMRAREGSTMMRHALGDDMHREAQHLGMGAAPGKVILFGEHAVVYGRPAIAVPVACVQATAIVDAAPDGQGFTIEAPDVGQSWVLDEAPVDDPLALIVRATLDALGIASAPSWTLTIRSTVPIAAGMGSGAAVSAAIVRALAQAAGRAVSVEQVSALAYQVERIHHGTPSGIDNTVVSYARPVYFIKGQPPQPLQVARPFWLVIADTGVRSPTRVAVGEVRRAWEADRPRYEAIFDEIAAVVEEARAALAAGAHAQLGSLMARNHALLQALGVSSPELERLIDAAQRAGAQGAKLVGAGRGGNLIALVSAERASAIA